MKKISPRTIYSKTLKRPLELHGNQHFTSDCISRFTRFLPLPLMVLGMTLTAICAHGQGEVKVGTNIPPMTRGSGISNKTPENVAPTVEDPRLASALGAFNAAARAKGNEAEVWKAISERTNVPVKILRQQRATARMSYADVLMVNVLAKKSGKSLAQIGVMRAAATNWTQLARQLQVDPVILVAGLNSAGVSLK